MPKVRSLQVSLTSAVEATAEEEASDLWGFPHERLVVGCERLCKTERRMCQQGQDRRFGDTSHTSGAGFLQLPVLVLACLCSQRGQWAQNWTNTERFPASQLGHPPPEPLQQHPGSPGTAMPSIMQVSCAGS